ncbi:uncharacterized protein BYT42DRAFT_609923 [Radiomyces spectabilis]|uniref:uncharacterized protein n=1 Tax=Radiomyces spectabilis TaxID=64574 RepID=UPI00221FD96B|nr:uncharacterized protein BYT42DRAFT_609923 [Radiomyces spectabilis]KAI8394187.1 hypothetical protein BYT42DRAFT_609923 [Radiomyces spectabilis]
MVQCDSCQQWFHADCINSLPKRLLYGDTFMNFRCSVCSQGPETYERTNMSWVTIVHLVIYNLMKQADLSKDRDHKYFRWKEDVCAFIDDYWEYLAPGKQRSVTWHNTIASVLSTHSSIFLSGFEKFHQSAWWTLHKEEPPVKDTKAKPPRIKPTLKKPLKRNRATEPSGEQDSADATKKRPKRKESTTEVQSPAQVRQSSRRSSLRQNKLKTRKESAPLTKEKEGDALDDDLSSLSELSSDEELFSAESDNETPAVSLPKSQASTKKKDDTHKPLDKVKHHQASVPSATSAAHYKQDSRTNTDSVSKRKAPIEADGQKNEAVTSKQATPSASPIDVSTKEHTPQLPPVAPSTIAGAQTEVVEKAKSKEIAKDGNMSDQVKETKDSKEIKDAKEPPRDEKPTPKKPYTAMLTQHDEWSLLQKLDHASKPLPSFAVRFKRKLAVRRLKRNLGMKVFDLDAVVAAQLRSKTDMAVMSKTSVIKPAINQVEDGDDLATPDVSKTLVPEIPFTPYRHSFASRLYGLPRKSTTITRDDPWLSPWNGRKLRPYIRRDFESKPTRMKLLLQIQEANGKPKRRYHESVDHLTHRGASIDYVYFQSEHLEQVNQMLCRSFWDGIDVSESLQFPEFSIVVLYKRCVIACAFMTPEAYITYIAVSPGWEDAGIGQFMLYHLFQTAISKDVTLHVSANNNAMILYQKFGFKPEEFIVNFYDKYLPSDSPFSKNAFFMRLRR